MVTSQRAVLVIGAVLALVCVGCGFAVQIDPPGEALSATTVPSERPSTTTTQAAPATTPQPQVTAPPPAVTFPSVGDLEAEADAESDAAPVCRSADAVTLRGARILNVASTPMSKRSTLTQEEQARAVAELNLLVQDARTMVEGTPDIAVIFGDREQSLAAIDALAQIARDEPADGDVRVGFQGWVDSHPEFVSRVIGETLSRCKTGTLDTLLNPTG